MIINFNKNKKPFLVHLVVWLIFLIILLFQVYNNNGSIKGRLIFLPVLGILIFYINYLYLVPKFLLKKRTIPYLLFAGLLIFLPLTHLLWATPPGPPPIELAENLRNSPPRPKPFFLLVPILINISFLVIGSSIRIYLEWNRNEIKKKEIENHKSKAELNFLKNQLSPHFLFNSLNSLYSLSVKKSDDAPEAIITLSELMRYMLYQTDNEYVTLQEELDYIENYLKLQRLRLANDEFVNFKINGTITSQKIRPLLLISFIENAFKYGTDFQGKTTVEIKINVTPKHLKFKCINGTENNHQPDNNSGIGLKNTRSRLDLLYPGKHKLEVSKKAKSFEVNLYLDLSL